jgi:predicted RND superfamily exporter protein
MRETRGNSALQTGEDIGRLCLGHRKTVLAILAAVSALALSQLPQVRFDNAIEIWFLDDDPGLISHDRLIEAFGSDELIFVGVEAPDVFAPEVLEVVDRVTRAVEEAPHVEKVFSITNIESITGRDGSLEVGELVEFPLDPALLPGIRERALANELYVGNVLSAAGDFTSIIARIPHIKQEFEYKVEAVSAIREILASEPETRFYLTGGPVIDDTLFHMAEVDSAITTALMVALLAVALAFLLRSVSGVVLPLVTVLLGTAWALGWMVLSGTRINSVTTMLPPMLLAIGVANAMHILVDYQNRCRDGEERGPALRAVYRELTVPCFLTSCTTAIGMLSLAVSELAAIREFGIFAAAGVFGAFLIAIALVPIALSYLPRPGCGRSGAPARVLSEGALRRLYQFTLRRGRWIAVASLVLFALSAAAATRVKSESAFMEWFRDSNRMKQDTRRIERALAGSLTVEVIVETEEEGGLVDPEVLREIVLLQDFLEAQSEAGASQSMVQYLKDMRRAFFDNDQREYRLPETREEAAQLLLLYELDQPEGDILEYVTSDHRQGRVSARITVDSSRAATPIVHRTQEYIATRFPAGLEGTVTGVADLYDKMERYMRQSLTRGFGIALVAIFLVFCAQMRSVLLGAIAMIPNVLPILMGLGLMGATGILLDGVTAMVASIAIGLAVDNTIHFVSRVRLHLDRGRSMDEALERATVEMGRALIYTTIGLCGGFALLTLSRLIPMAFFGLLCSVTIFLALAANLLLLPVVLRWYGRRISRRGARLPRAAH